MNGNMKNNKHTTHEMHNDTISAFESEGRAATFNHAAKYISRYPSTKNLKKLLKK